MEIDVTDKYMYLNEENKLKGIVDKVNKQNPDIILLTGDTIDDKTKSDICASFQSAICDIIEK